MAKLEAEVVDLQRERDDLLSRQESREGEEEGGRGAGTPSKGDRGGNKKGAGKKAVPRKGAIGKDRPLSRLESSKKNLPQGQTQTGASLSDASTQTDSSPRSNLLRLSDDVDSTKVVDENSNNSNERAAAGEALRQKLRNKRIQRRKTSIGGKDDGGIEDVGDEKSGWKGANSKHEEGKGEKGKEGGGTDMSVSHRSAASASSSDARGEDRVQSDAAVEGRSEEKEEDEDEGRKSMGEAFLETLAKPASDEEDAVESEMEIPHAQEKDLDDEFLPLDGGLDLDKEGSKAVGGLIKKTRAVSKKKSKSSRLPPVVNK